MIRPLWLVYRSYWSHIRVREGYFDIFDTRVEISYMDTFGLHETRVLREINA